MAMLAGGLLTAGTAAAQKMAPAFALPDVNGEPYTLAQFAGKPVVLEWINYDCPFVRKFYTAGTMQTWQEKYTAKGVVWLSICSSAPGTQGHYAREEWNKRIADQKVKATAVLLDETGETGKAYGAKTTPHMYVINPEGQIVYAGAIDDKRSTRQEDITTARNYVIEALKALASGEAIEVAETQAYGCSVKYK